MNSSMRSSSAMLRLQGFLLALFFFFLPLSSARREEVETDDEIDDSRERSRGGVVGHEPSATSGKGSLYMQGNDIAYMEDGAIDHITSITHLDLSSNRLTELPNGGDFCDISVTTGLKLNNNRVTFLPTGVFTNTRCEYL
ncbi:hypothetical protein NP493_567g04008 [Ridgeia piscesae]|uniref:Uncharacterized protein n=1 Tax=Ridgeia piscesae TaxID=27915 RepID=A0AAD9NRK4_RIDPI|nr:hypothetical protein NP493_567g04008 [Ridgeia piscesae]